MFQEIHVVTSVAQIPDAEHFDDIQTYKTHSPRSKLSSMFDMWKLADFFFRRRPATYPPFPTYTSHLPGLAPSQKEKCLPTESIRVFPKIEVPRNGWWK